MCCFVRLGVVCAIRTNLDVLGILLHGDSLICLLASRARLCDTCFLDREDLGEAERVNDIRHFCAGDLANLGAGVHTVRSKERSRVSLRVGSERMQSRCKGLALPSLSFVRTVLRQLVRYCRPQSIVHLCVRRNGPDLQNLSLLMGRCVVVEIDLVDDAKVSRTLGLKDRDIASNIAELLLWSPRRREIEQESVLCGACASDGKHPPQDATKTAHVDAPYCLR